MACEQRHIQKDTLTLSAYVDGELSAGDAASITAHLAACPACTSEVDELRALGRLMVMARRSSLGEPSALVMERMRAHVRDLTETSDAALIWMARIFSGVAASVLIGGLWLLNQPGVPVSAETVAVTLSVEPAPQQAPDLHSPEAVVADLSGRSHEAESELP